MKKKTILVVVLLLFVIGIVVVGSFGNNIKTAAQVVEGDETSAFYVDSTSNVFVIIAQFIEKCSNLLIVGIFNIITKIFEFIFGI